jgi:hypothetical protein
MVRQFGIEVCAKVHLPEAFGSKSGRKTCLLALGSRLQIGP